MFREYSKPLSKLIEADRKLVGMIPYFAYLKWQKLPESTKLDALRVTNIEDLADYLKKQYWIKRED